MNRVIMALRTAKICKEKGEKRVLTRLRPLTKPDCSGFSVLKAMANLLA